MSVCIRLIGFNPFGCSAINDCDYVITIAWGREGKSDEKLMTVTKKCYVIRTLVENISVELL